MSGCLDCLSRHGIDVSESSSQLDIVWVPGSFELPIVSQALARKGKYEVVITLGAVIRNLGYEYKNNLRAYHKRCLHTQCHVNTG